jgi:hypothetical protein
MKILSTGGAPGETTYKPGSLIEFVPDAEKLNTASIFTGMGADMRTKIIGTMLKGSLIA